MGKFASGKIQYTNSAHNADLYQAFSASHALRSTQVITKMRLMDIGQAVRLRRKELKLTLQEVCERMDIEFDTGNLSRAERGAQDFSSRALESVSKALDCTVAELYGYQVDAVADDATNKYTSTQWMNKLKESWPDADIKAFIYKLLDELDGDAALALATDLMKHTLAQRDKKQSLTPDPPNPKS